MRANEWNKSLSPPTAPAGDEAGSPGFAQDQSSSLSKSAVPLRANKQRQGISGLELDVVRPPFSKQNLSLQSQAGPCHDAFVVSPDSVWYARVLLLIWELAPEDILGYVGI